jgi:aspartyl-tRNA(Asn)/glutamyl-tRNA(Gln) amidotransferase subunit A
MTYSSDLDLYRNGTLSVAERVQQIMARAQERADLQAFAHVAHDSALASAAESDERFASGLARPLEGCAIAIKDNISVKGMPLTCASNMLEDYHPVFNATVIEQLHDAGAVIVGKTNMDEFAMGSSNENSRFGPAKHPLDPSRVPGGSSGGSAVVVADDQAHVALGSDTGGSVRQPAAFCGVYGLKPTYGRISRYGLVAFASSLDQIGIFANSVEDTAAVLDVISGHDPMDSTSHPNAQTNALEVLNSPLPSYTVGVLPESMLDGCDDEIKRQYRALIERCKAQGASTVEITLPHQEIWIPTYFILATAEASSNLARFDGVRYGHRGGDEADMMTSSRSEGFGAEVKRRIMLGTYVLSAGYSDAYYRNAQRSRRMIANAYADVFKTVDVIAMPTTPTTAFVRGEITDPVQMWLSDMYTVSANIAGIPAISIPFGADGKGLPIGMQLQGPMFGDEKMLAISQAISAV